MKVLAGSGAGIARDFDLFADGSAAGIILYVGDLILQPQMVAWGVGRS